MSELKATPWPWAVYSDDEVYSTQEGTANGHPMVIVPDSCLGRDDFDYEDKMPSKAQCRYNAHLIAAAPELYESNQELARHVVELCAVMGVPVPSDSFERHRAASARARGEH